MPLELKIPWKRTSIAIVDDNIGWRRTVRSMVSSFGVTEITEATDGSDFLTKIEKQNSDVDLLLIDDEMLPMDGFVLMTSLRTKAREPLRRTTALLMAGQNSADIARRAQEAGYNGVLAKPFSARELDAAAQRTLLAPVQWREEKGFLRPVLLSPPA